MSEHPCRPDRGPPPMAKSRGGPPPRRGHPTPHADASHHGSPSLPRRWSRRQRLKNTALFHLIRAGVALLRAAPRVAAAPLSAVLGRLAAACARHERQRAGAQLAHALPALTAGARRRVVRDMFVHLARSVLELGHLPALLRGPHAVALPPAARAVLDAALAEGRGVVVVSGHIGNWELLAQVVAHAGYPATTVAKPLYDPRLTAWLAAQRGAFGLGQIWRGEAGASRALLRVFRSRGILALLIDQDTRVEGAFVPFFGRPAFTPTAAATLALRYGAPVVLATIRRTGGTHQIRARRLPVAAGAPTPERVIALTATMTAALEAEIRAAPSQWVWLHARWRRQPEAP